MADAGAMADAAVKADDALAKVVAAAKALHAAWDAPCNNDACADGIRGIPFWGACNSRGAGGTCDDAAHGFQTRKTIPGTATRQ